MTRKEQQIKEQQIGSSEAASPPAGIAALPRLQQQAMALYRAGRKRRALEACRAILALQPERPDVLGFAGMIAVELDSLEDALGFYRRALALRPDFPEAHYNLAHALQRLGRHEAAAESYRRAVALKPDLAPAHHNLGSVLQAMGRWQEAVASYRRALALNPAPATELDLGIALERLGAAEEAAAAFRRAVALAPDWSDAHGHLVHALIGLRDLAGAVAACDAWLARDPANIQALALKAVALNEGGESAAARVLYDFDRFVEIRDFAAPPGFASLADFNAALVAHVESHPTLKVPPQDHPTYHHAALQITEELLVEPKGPMAALEAMMREAVLRYLAKVRRAPAHPFLEHFPERWTLRAWGTRLAGEGNLVPHIHLEGYLGAVYYPKLPSVVHEPAGEEAGWFELGRPPAALGCEAAPLTRRIQPKEGRMLLFPGYFFHNTVPFQSRETRISIAFDLVAA